MVRRRPIDRRPSSICWVQRPLAIRGKGQDRFTAGEAIRPLVAPEVAQRIREPAPEGLFVLGQSLPVVSFGDPERAAVATLSLNPSWLEFQSTSDRWLTGGEQRLVSLASLGLTHPAEMTDEHVAAVVQACNDYFQGPNWYKGWFHWLEDSLVDSDAGSYLDGSACHLDLVQWATKPAQGELDKIDKSIWPASWPPIETSSAGS
jgi:hypothetical protein